MYLQRTLLDLGVKKLTLSMFIGLLLSQEFHFYRYFSEGKANFSLSLCFHVFLSFSSVSLSASGSHLAVSAASDRVSTGYQSIIGSSGSVYTYEKNASDVWNFKQRIRAPDEGSFGRSVFFSESGIQHLFFGIL